MVITLKLIKEPEIPLEVEVISPDALAGKSIDDIKKLKVYEGKIEHELAEFFEVTGETENDAANLKIEVKQSSKKLRRIGESMTTGEIEVNGDVGMHLGDYIKGGRIVVYGNADSYVGSEMEGGEIHIKGDAGDYIGSAYRGNWRGMKGGKITIDGNAGFEIGAWLRGTKKSRAKREPLIHIKGNVGLHAGHHNHGGFIIIEGDAEGRAGSEMARGDIIIFGNTDVMASFQQIEDVNEIPELDIKGTFAVFTGDLGINGKGKLYLKK
ncbi:MAG: formylmethanofuran dehydrogenase subunit C [Promethearchaeota archaeon]